MTSKKSKVLGHNKAPKEHVRRDRPTHACFHPDGSTSIVFPEGHDPETLVKLPRGYSEETHEPDHANRTFVRRASQLRSAAEPDLRERIRRLEQQIAALTQGER